VKTCIFFLGIPHVYQQIAREKTNPERHLKSHLEAPEDKKNHNNDLHGRERYTKAFKKIYLVIKKELQTQDLIKRLKQSS